MEQRRFNWYFLILYIQAYLDEEYKIHLFMRKNTVEAQISFFVAIMPCHYSEIRSKKYGMTQYRTNYLINEIDKFKIRNLTRKSSNYKLTLKSLKFSSKIIIYIMQIWKTQLGIQISHGCLFVLLQYLPNILLLVLLFFSFFLPFSFLFFIFIFFFFFWWRKWKRKRKSDQGRKIWWKRR